MPLRAADIHNIIDRIRAGEIDNAQALLAEGENVAKQEEEDAAIAAGKPPPERTTDETLVDLLTEIVVHLGSKESMNARLKTLRDRLVTNKTEPVAPAEEKHE